MAQKLNVSFVDDLDGTEAEGTVVFAVDGKQYEIDLSETNAAKLRELFAPYASAARRLSGGPRSPRTSSVARGTRQDTRAIREWAVGQGIAVSTRGRVSSEVLMAYKARDDAPAVVEPVAEVAPVKRTRARAKVKQPEFSGAE